MTTAEHTYVIARLQETQGSLRRVVRCEDDVRSPASYFSFACGPKNYRMGNDCYETIHVCTQVAVWHIMND
jgi:hypothetical protein